jgi:hypothetical protein
MSMDQVTNLSLLYRWGRLPMSFIYEGGRVIGIGTSERMEPIVGSDGRYHCIVCGEALTRNRKRLCPTCDRKIRYVNFGNDSFEYSWSSFREKVWLRDSKKCAHCGCDLSSCTFVCDHIIPLFKGGRDWWEDPTMINFQTLCKDCNNKKTGDDFRKPIPIEQIAIPIRPKITFGHMDNYLLL